MVIEWDFIGLNGDGHDGFGFDTQMLVSFCQAMPCQFFFGVCVAETHYMFSWTNTIQSLLFSPPSCSSDRITQYHTPFIHHMYTLMGYHSPTWIVKHVCVNIFVDGFKWIQVCQLKFIKHIQTYTICLSNMIFSLKPPFRVDFPWLC